MRRARDDQSEESGQDAFLDIVANMVGIMILLVMVVGLRVSHEVTASSAKPGPDDTAAAPPISRSDLDQAVRQALASKRDLHDLANRVVEVRYDAMLREQERNGMATFVAAFEAELDQRRDELSEDDRRDFDTQRKLKEAELTLDRLTREQVSLMSQDPDVEVIENEPTPMVRGFSGQEVYVQLSGGHAAVIPAAELIEKFQQDVRRNVWRLKDEDRLVGTVGPIDGYRLRYFIRKRTVVVQSQPGMHQGVTVPQVVRCEFLPLVTPPGEPVQQAILPNSDLFRHLKNHPPESTVIAIGVYSDSISELHQLKRKLIEEGFSTAELLMPDGKPLGFAPQGRKVRVQ